jgi:hypothetical protein
MGRRTVDRPRGRVRSSRRRSTPPHHRLRRGSATARHRTTRAERECDGSACMTAPFGSALDRAASVSPRRAPVKRTTGVCWSCTRVGPTTTAACRGASAPSTTDAPRTPGGLPAARLRDEQASPQALGSRSLRTIGGGLGGGLCRCWFRRAKRERPGAPARDRRALDQSRSPALADIIGARRVRTVAMISSGSIPCR